MRAIRRGRHEAPRLMACLLQLAPACSRVETFVGFGWETPRVFANPLTELTCHKSRRSIDSANRAPVGRRLFVGVWASGVARFRGYAVRLVGERRLGPIVRGFAACKAKLYAIVSHGECYIGTTKGGQGASVAFEEVLSSCLSCFPWYQAAKQGLSSHDGSACWFSCQAGAMNVAFRHNTASKALRLL